MAHDFKKNPELTNSQMQFYYFQSPHKQIMEDIRVEVIKVHDGDTITVRWKERDFDFPVRFLGTDSPELNEEGGHEARDFLKDLIEGEEVDILINKNNRVGKWGRLLGKIRHRGLDVGNMMLNFGWAKTFEARREGEIPDINIMLDLRQWL